MTGLIARDLFRLRWLASPRISPDGDRVAFRVITLSSGADRVRSRAAVAAVATGRTRWIDEVPDPAGIAWAPDGSALVVSAPSGVWVADAGGGGVRRLAAGPAIEAAWSPGGGTLAFIRAGEAGRPGQAADPAGRIWAVSPDGGEPRPLTHPGEARHLRWSPDGRALAFLAGDAVWVTGGDLSARPARLPGQPAAVTAFAWSPGSRAVACLGRRDRDLVDVGQRLWIVDRANGSARELPHDGDAFIGSPVRGDDPRGASPQVCWSGRTGRIYVEASLHGRGPLAWLAPGSGASGLLLDGEHACLSPSVSSAGRLAVVISGPDGPGDIWVAGEDGRDTVRLTGTDDELAGLMAPTRYLAVESQGVKIDAWITGSAAGGPAPLLVNVHGGPYYAVGWRFTFEVQRMAARGALVLTLNPRGSAGRGDEFAAGNRGDWGGADAADITAVVDAAAARDDVDDARIAIWGASYGGFMAQWLVTRSRRYRAGISENGISNFRDMWAAGQDRRAFWTLAMGGTPDDTDRYERRSPVRSADRIRAPLLLVHAEEDDNCPIAQSAQMFEALRGRGADAELVRLPGEGHLVNLVGRPSSRLRRAEAVDRWLDRTLFAGKTAAER
ncbi:MAG TPA: S9 family peptidase [Streptosporangiaceae bacterium]|nr:S9 family peptidase [Streptosporangiaceae bacterium]